MGELSADEAEKWLEKDYAFMLEAVERNGWALKSPRRGSKSASDNS